jgi:excinuclease UvrABC nuclease subunit
VNKAEILKALIDYRITCSDAALLPRPIGGVYLLQQHGEVAYIGSSCDLATRLRNHEHKHESALIITEPNYEQLERLLIRRFKPRLNRTERFRTSQEAHADLLRLRRL